jgi:hypothetical protein
MAHTIITIILIYIIGIPICYTLEVYFNKKYGSFENPLAIMWYSWVGVLSTLTVMLIAYLDKDAKIED